MVSRILTNADACCFGSIGKTLSPQKMWLPKGLVTISGFMMMESNSSFSGVRFMICSLVYFFGLWCFPDCCAEEQSKRSALSTCWTS